MQKNKYKYIKETREDKLVLLTLDRLPSNELNPDFMQEIIELHEELAKDEEAQGVILSSSSPRYFCNGMEPEYILAQNAAGRKEAFVLFLKMVRDLYAFPKPHFALIEGHAMGGGAFLGIVSDFRYLAEGPFRYCFSEVSVNLTIPPSLLAIVRETVHPPYMRKLAMQAYAFRPREALEAGLADFVCPPTELLQKAKKDMIRLLRYSPRTLISIKENLRYSTLRNMKKYDQEMPASTSIEAFLGKDFEDSLRSLLKRKKS